MKNHFYRRVIVLPCLLASALCFAQTDNAVYRCIGDDGVPTYTNNIVGLKNCQTVTGVSVTTIPAFKPPPTPAVVATNTATASSRSAVAASDFPRVDNELQRQRDETGRRPILERELRDREERCAATKKDLNGGSVRVPGESDSGFANRVAAMQTQVDRCAADIAAIKRELAALK
jgi:Domain of unknown function (DUF4124)